MKLQQHREFWFKPLFNHDLHCSQYIIKEIKFFFFNRTTPFSRGLRKCMLFKVNVHNGLTSVAQWSAMSHFRQKCTFDFGPFLCFLATNKPRATQITCLFHISFNSGDSEMRYNFGFFSFYNMKLAVSHNFLCHTLLRLIFSESDNITYMNIFCSANIDVNPHQRHAVFILR